LVLLNLMMMIMDLMMMNDGWWAWIKPSSPASFSHPILFFFHKDSSVSLMIRIHKCSWWSLLWFLCLCSCTVYVSLGIWTLIKYFPFHNSLSFVLGEGKGGSLVYFEYLLNSMGYY
jgi:hypothetical protein